MKKFFTQKLPEGIVKFTELSFMKIIMNSFLGISALTIAGSLFMLVSSLPLGSWYTDFLANSGLSTILNFPVRITTELISLYLIIAVGYNTAKEKGSNPFSGAIISLAAFLILTPLQMAVTLTTEAGETVSGLVDGIAMGLGGPFTANGMFLALFVGYFATSLYSWLLKKNIKIKMPQGVPANVSNMFETMLPATIVFIVFMVVRYGVSLTPFETCQRIVFFFVQLPLTNVSGGIGGYVAFIVAGSLLWLFGVHGGMIAYVTLLPVITVINQANIAAFLAGTPVPHPEWLFQPWTFMGGAGSTFAFVILMTFFAKSTHLKTLGKLSLGPGLFEINEPVTFGAPIIMNPFLAIPFVITPVINFFLTYFVMNIGLVAWPTGATINNFMPVGIFGSLVNAHWTGFVWSLVIIVVDVVVWYPFFKGYDNSKVVEESKFAEATVEVESASK